MGMSKMQAVARSAPALHIGTEEKRAPTETEELCQLRTICRFGVYCRSIAVTLNFDAARYEFSRTHHLTVRYACLRVTLRPRRQKLSWQTCIRTRDAVAAINLMHDEVSRIHPY